VSSVSGAHTDSRIERLGGARGLAGSGDGVRVLEVEWGKVLAREVGRILQERLVTQKI
jgi:hypothetical protein